MDILLLSGSPGTGKTTIAKRLEEKYDYFRLSLGEIVKQQNFSISFDLERESLVIDEEKLRSHVDEKIFSDSSQKKIVIESHYSDIIIHPYISVGIILRCHPNILQERLSKRNYSNEKILENKYAELLGDCSSFMINNPKLIDGRNIFEIDTSELEPDKIAEICNQILQDPKYQFDFKFGKISWLSDPSIDISEYHSLF